MKKFFFLFCIFAIHSVFISCMISSYSVQLFTGDNIVLADTYKSQAVDGQGNTVEKETSAIFKGSSLDDVLVKASKAGYTKILSIETWSQTSLFIIPIPIKRVAIRCSKE